MRVFFSCLLIASTISAVGAEVEPEPLEKYLLKLTRPAHVNYLAFTGRGSFFINDFALDENYQGEVKAIRIRYSPQEHGMRLHVYLFKTPYSRFMTVKQIAAAPQELIAEFSLAPNQVVAVEKLAEAGLEPLQFELLENFSQTDSPFEISVETPSVVPVELEERLAAFWLNLLNRSDKAVICLRVAGQRRSASPGQDLIPPFETLRWELPKPVQLEEEKDRQEPYLIEIRTAVFDDYTFEGDAAEALSFIAGRRGFQLGLPPVLAVMESLPGGNRPDIRDAARQLAVV